MLVKRAEITSRSHRRRLARRHTEDIFMYGDICLCMQLCYHYYHYLSGALSLLHNRTGGGRYT